MCLIKIRKEEDEDEYVPVRRVVRTSRERVGVRTSSPHRHSSKVIAVHTPEPRIVVPPPPRPLPVESAPGYQVPPPQPTPVFVQPPPPPPAPAAPQTEVHYVHVSPRSSISNDHSHGRNEDDLYTYRREVRYERDYSPPRDDYYHYRHVEGPPRSRSRHRERSRSRSRRRYEDEYDDYSDDGRRRTVRVKRTSYRD